MQKEEYLIKNACYSVTKYYLCKQNNKRSLLGRKQRNQVTRSFLNRYQFSSTNKVTSLFSTSCILRIILNSQRGDNAASYAKYTGYSTDQALAILLANGVTINSNGILSLKEGQEIFDGTFHLSDVVVYGKSKSSQSIPNSSQRRNVSELSISQQGINFLIAREGMITLPYNDSKGFATIGVGHLLHKSKVTDADRRAWTRFTKNDAKNF